MSDLKGKRILIFQQRGWAKNVGRFLARKLQKEGCELSAITFKKTTHEMIKAEKEVNYKYIVNIDEIYENPEKILEGEDITLEEICKELNINSVWPMIASDRLLVRSYIEKYYYSYKQNVPDEFIEKLIKAHYKVIRNLFEQFKPDLVFMATFVYEGHVLLNLFADKYNIPILAPTDSRIPGYYIFSRNYKHEQGSFHERLAELNSGKAETHNRAHAEEYIRQFRDKFKKPNYVAAPAKKKTLIELIKKELSPYKQIISWYIKGPAFDSLKSVGATVDYIPPAILLRDHFCFKRNKKFTERFCYYPFDKIKKFVYFPLQVHPEATLDLMAPYFNNQIEIARQTAMSLPDDYTLVVKEHPAMIGLRAPSYIEKISRTPNVKIIDFRISTEKILRKANLVISPNSTTLAEAAFYNKPAIQFGDLGITLKLPNIIRHTDMTTLSGKIKELLNKDLNNDDYERKLKNYIAAVFDAGFNTNYHKVWEKGDMSLLDRLLGNFVNEIKNTLNIK
ncbi:hypothetical protein COV49_03670 [Candidatus Falkowbacteria bacterium CG11_big_fil_rev_8_21_14_0_20_39_10]|uniref:Capsule polysaccharide biosynthesis protein n=1 Tax=Candidatus Falkowbacteria bacterium CG11_big_fil_rev_8_21_14_0_20_39_10 TaxID=1974570 RepID=A0A2M6K893_9BACT|nr:MAG: hypothetical protein COV49_03670 [Candidatus Falkowbacteria bacterium CG11_big_fil_rev_8_21_14_0_20_39_10]